MAEATGAAAARLLSIPFAFHEDEFVSELAVDHEFNLLAVASSRHKIHIFKAVGEPDAPASTYKWIPEYVISSHDGGVISVCFSGAKYGIFLASCSFDGTVMIHEPVTRLSFNNTANAMNLDTMENNTLNALKNLKIRKKDFVSQTAWEQRLTIRPGWNVVKQLSLGININSLKKASLPIYSNAERDMKSAQLTGKSASQGNIQTFCDPILVRFVHPFAEAGLMLFVATSQGMIYVWLWHGVIDLSGVEEVATFVAGEDPSQLPPNSASKSGKLSFFDTREALPQLLYPEESRRITAMEISLNRLEDDGLLCAVGLATGLIQIWRIQLYKPAEIINTFRKHTEKVTSLAWQLSSGYIHRVASTSIDKKVIIFCFSLDTTGENETDEENRFRYKLPVEQPAIFTRDMIGLSSKFDLFGKNLCIVEMDENGNKSLAWFVRDFDTLQWRERLTS